MTLFPYTTLFRSEASYKLAADLNMEAKESEEEDDDEIDWEEGW